MIVRQRKIRGRNNGVLRSSNRINLILIPFPSVLAEFQRRVKHQIGFESFPHCDNQPNKARQINRALGRVGFDRVTHGIQQGSMLHSQARCLRLGCSPKKSHPVPIATKSLTEAVAEDLGWLGDLGFRYLRSNQQFRRDDSGGCSYITLNSVTHNRVDYHVAFYLGVRSDPLESIIRRIRGDSSGLTHDDRSIHHYSVNTGPTNHGWRQPLVGTWTLRNLSEFSSITAPMQAYVRGVALPFLDQNQSPESIRTYLMDFPGHTQSRFPWRQILGADVLAGDQSRLDADFEALSSRYARFIPELRSDFESFYHGARNHI